MIGFSWLAVRRRMLDPRSWLVWSSIVVAMLGGASVADAGVAHQFVRSFGVSFPRGLTISQSSSDVYVADRENNTVDVYGPTGEYLPSLQLTGTPAGAPVSGHFGAANDVAIDQANGNIYVADDNNGVVDIFKANGEYASQIGGGETPTGSMSPWAVAVNEANGDVYVVDSSNQAVDVFDATGKYLPSLRLTGTPVGAPVSGPFGFLTKIAINQVKGKVYVADAFGTIDVFKANGEYLSQINGSKTPGGAIVPEGLAIDQANGDVYVGDGIAGAVDQFSEAGEYQTQIPGSATPSGSMTPSELTVDDAHNIYVADQSNGVVDVFDSLNTPTGRLGAPSDVQARSVVLNGSVNPSGVLVSSCVFEYGVETSYGKSVECEPSPGSGETAVAVSGSVSGLLPHTLYHYRLTATNAAGADSTSDGSFETGLVAPVVVSMVVSNVLQTSVVFSGSIDPENVPAAYHFAYGTSPSYGSVAPIPDLYVPANEASDATVEQLVGGLTPGTTYHYALVAEGSGGVTVGPDQTFTTPPVPLPSVVTGGSSGVGVGAATLSGSIDPHGWETTYSFQYGTSVAYGSSWPTVPVSLGALEGAQGVLTSVERLQPGTVYHYRLVASDAGGTSYGQDQTFTTGEYPASVVQSVPLLAADLGFVDPEAEPGVRSRKASGGTKALANALRACERKPKGQRAKCKRQARRRYGVGAKK